MNLGDMRSAGSTSADAGDTHAYAVLYTEQHPRLVAYARSLTGNTWLAADVVDEAHFRLWQRLSSGHRVTDAPAYLAAAVRDLAAGATVGTGAGVDREIAQGEPGAAARGSGRQAAAGADTGEDQAQRVAYVDLLAGVLRQLPGTLGTRAVAG
jgi:DNA-directed RNA polymerase specialized sigma24 family protein